MEGVAAGDLPKMSMEMMQYFFTSLHFVENFSYMSRHDCNYIPNVVNKRSLVLDVCEFANQTHITMDLSNMNHRKDNTNRKNVTSEHSSRYIIIFEYLFINNILF